MGKRVPPDQQEYRPVNEQLARSVLNRQRSLDEDNAQPRVRIVEREPTPPPGADKIVGLTPPEDVERSTPEASTSSRATPDCGATDKREPIRSRRRDMVCEKRMLLTKKEDERFAELVSSISRELDTKVKESNLLRACLTLLVNVEGELRKQCRRVRQDGRIKRPRYDQPTEIVAFEDHLARIFDTAIRNARSYDQ
jgi:hypothetical protein